MPIRKSLRKIAVLCHIARSILNRCERVALLRKDLWVLMKRQSLIWVDSKVMCFMKRGSWAGGCFWEQQIDKLVKKSKFGGMLFCSGQQLFFENTKWFMRE